MVCHSTVYLLVVLGLSAVLASHASVREIGHDAITDGMLQRKESAESHTEFVARKVFDPSHETRRYEHECKPLLRNCNSKVGKLLRKRSCCVRSVKKVKRANRHAASVNDDLLATLIATLGNLTQCYVTKKQLEEDQGSPNESCNQASTVTNLIQFAPDRIFYFKLIPDPASRVTWEGAKAACADLGMTLAVVQSSIRPTVIAYMLANKAILTDPPGNSDLETFWTAGTDVATEGTIVWDSSDQPPEAYTGPFNDGSMDCFTLGDELEEAFLGCSFKYSYICQVKPECLNFVTSTPYP